MGTDAQITKADTLTRDFGRHFAVFVFSGLCLCLGRWSMFRLKARLFESEKVFIGGPASGMGTNLGSDALKSL